MIELFILCTKLSCATKARKVALCVCRIPFKQSCYDNNKLTIAISKIERNYPERHKKTVSCLQDYPKRLAIMHRYLKEIFTSEVYEIHFLCTR